jgi:hypothetical protein
MEITTPAIASTLPLVDHEMIVQAIQEGRNLTLEYKNNPRHVIPLAFGMCRNGRQGLLCLKVDVQPNGQQVYSIRLYYGDCLSNIALKASIKHSRRGIEYYCTRHFRQRYI